MFKITKEDQDKIKIWMEGQDKKVVDFQNKKNNTNYTQPYYGMTGDGYTYSFTPTSIGTFISVKNNATKEELELDFDW